jgi:hypothetical protein
VEAVESYCVEQKRSGGEFLMSGMYSRNGTDVRDDRVPLIYDIPILIAVEEFLSTIL